MPVVVMHGGSGAAGGGNVSSKSMGPNSHLCLAVITLVVNPPLGRCRHRSARESDNNGKLYKKAQQQFWISLKN